MTSKYTFEISLSVLNALGRNLYRNFITVLGEAISNSWDADASNVRIYIDKDTKDFMIKDDGLGMTSDDFQNKFLKIGYTKRKDGRMKSPGGRPYIGAKGIGKLALLSCAQKISIATKTQTTDYTGGVIDNRGLTKAINEDLTPQEYELGNLDLSLFKPFIHDHEKGTLIYFGKVNDDVKDSAQHLKKLIALYFRFSLVDRGFNLFVNDEKVDFEDIKELSEATEFLWNINKIEDPFIWTLSKLKKEVVNIGSNLRIKGFIGTVEKPKYLKIQGTEEKVGIDLFVNGRLREKDILQHASDFSTRHIASYLYGQIHFDELDQDGKDRFTSNREAIIQGDYKYKELIEELKEKILPKIANDWDEFRLSRNEEGDDENPRKSIKERKALSLYNLSSLDYTQDQNEKINKWVIGLQPDAEFNIPAYVDCFLSENLLRKHIEENKLSPTSCTNTDPAGKSCESRYDPKTGSTSLCEYCKGQRGKKSLQDQKKEANTSIQVRNSEENLLFYLDYVDLAKIIGNDILNEEDKSYKPLRNSVMHTSQLTKEAKTKLNSVFDNIVATVKGLVGSVLVNK